MVMLYLEPGLNTKYMVAMVSLAAAVDEVSESAAHLVLFVFVEMDPLVAPPALQQAVLAHPLVRLHVRSWSQTATVWEPALDEVAHHLDSLLCYQAASPVI